MDISKFKDDPAHKAMMKQRENANNRIREAYKKGADISTIGKMRNEQTTMEHGQHNILHERAEAARMAGKGSHDPVYENSKKNK